MNIEWEGLIQFWKKFCKRMGKSADKYLLADFIILNGKQDYDPSLMNAFKIFIMDNIESSVLFKIIGAEMDEFKLHVIDGVFEGLHSFTADAVIVFIATYIDGNFITYKLKLLSDIDLNNFSRELSKNSIDDDVVQHHNSINMAIFKSSENDENVEIKLCK